MKQSVPAFKLPLVLFFLLFSSMIASAATYYWVGGNGTWDGVSPTFWSNASGGAPGAGPPTAGDTAIFDVNSFTQAGDTVYLSGNVFAAKVEWNGVANFPTFSQAYGDTLLLGGSLIIDPNMALDLHGTIKFNGSSGNHIIDTHSKLLDADIRFNGTAQWELASDLETLKNLILNQGNFNTKGYYLRCFVFDGHASQSLTRSLTLDSSYVRINDTWDMSSTTGLTFDAGQSVIEINKIPGQGNFYGGDLVYNEVTFYSGQVVATGDNQFNKLEIDSGIITFPAGGTQTFYDFAANNVGFQVTINSDSPGTQTNLTSLSGKKVCMDNMYLTDIAFSGASCYSSASTDGGNNAGITFASCPPALSATITDTVHVTCNGASDGWAVVYPSGGTPPYSYHWDDPSIQTTDTAVGLAGGFYNVLVTDADNDSAWASVNINEPGLLNAGPIVNNLTCVGSCDGDANINPTGGVPPYSYLWDANAGNATTVSVNSLCLGFYLYTVTDNNGCSFSDTVFINDPPSPLALGMDKGDVLCNGSCDGFGVAQPTAGTPPYSFQWDINAGYQTNDTATGLCAGHYLVTVTDNNGCIAVDSVDVGEPSALSIGFNSGDALCSGACDGFAKANPSGGVPPYSFQWDSNAGSQTVDSVGSLCSGTYFVTVTDNNGCQSSNSIIITEPSVLTNAMTPVNGAMCPGSCDGSAKANPTGGVAPYTFQWDSNAGSQTVDSVGGLCAGTYLLTITDNNGCMIVDSAMINEPTPMYPTFNKGDALCAGACDGFAKVNPTGGVPPYSFQWDANAGNQTVDSVFGLCAGWYFISVTDNNGCFVVDSVEIMEPSAVITSFGAVMGPQCNGGCDGYAKVLPTGGVAPYSFQWDINAGYQTVDSASGLCAGMYYVTVTDNNGCTAVDSITINEPGLLNASFNKGDVLCAGACNGFARVNPVGGVPPYSFQWDSNAGSATVDSVGGLCIGWYHVTVTDNNGCFMADSVEIMEPPVITNAFTPVNAAACAGSCDGSAMANPSGGVAPYSFQWDINAGYQTTQTATNLCTGNYLVTISDNNGCTYVDSVFIGEPAAVMTTFNKGDVLCAGSCNGFAKVNPTGGTPPYSFLWDSNAGSATVDSVGGLCIGWYHVTVTDNNGCFMADSVEIMEPPVITNAFTPVNAAACAGSCDGSAMANPSGGVAPYSFQWDINAGYQTTQTATNLCTGNYLVTISDNNGCSYVDSVFIGEPTAVMTTFNKGDVLCAGSCNGFAKVNPTGGTPPYSFLWDANAGSATVDSVGGLCIGWYHVTVTDNNGCFMADSVEIMEPSAVITSFGAVMGPQCNGGCDGYAKVLPTGGVAPYSFQWDINAGYQTVDSASGLCAGMYYVTVTDNNGCTAVDSISINEPGLLNASFNKGDVLCAGACDGFARVNPAGGVAPYTFQWDSNAGSATVDSVGGLCIGWYHVTVTDNNGCFMADSVEIMEPPVITNAFTPVNAAACAGSCDGSAMANPSGGVAPYSFQWDINAGYQTTQTATNLCTGNYLVTISDNNGCSYVDSVFIGEPTAVMTTFNKGDVLCAGACDGFAKVNPVGGVPPYSFQWDSNAGSATVDSVGGLCIGWYHVTVTDNNGCFMADSVEIMEPSAVMTSFGAVMGPQCNGGCDGYAKVLPTGGVAPYTFQWDINAGYQTVDSASGLCAGTYYVTVTDNNGCTAVDSISINEPGLLNASFNKGDVLCAGACNGFARVNPVGGVPPYSFQWDSNAGSATVDSVGGLCMGWYHVTVTDNNGCFTEDSVQIMQPNPIVINTNKGDELCAGACNGFARAMVSGGAAPYLYSWDDPQGQTTDSAFGLCPGNYHVTVTDNNGCMAIDSVLISGATSIITTVNGNDPNCSGACDGDANVNATGGVPPYTFQWDANAGNQNTQLATGLCAGMYYVTVTGSNGCSVVDSITLNDPPGMVITSINKTDVLCHASCNGTATVNFSGGTAPHTILWDDLSNSTSASVNALCAGWYHVTVTDNNGCFITDSVEITEPSDIVLTPSTSNATCGGANGSGTISVTGGVSPYTFQWPANAASQTTATANNLTSGNYLVMVSDANGCMDSVVVIINETGGPSLTVGKTDASCFGACDGTATANPSGGTTPYAYQWGPLTGNQTTQTATNLCKGLYYVTVTDGSGCSSVDTVSIMEPGEITMTFSETPASCQSYCDGTLMVTPVGGATPYGFLWDDPSAQTTQTAINLCTGAHNVTVTDANGCSATMGQAVSFTGSDPILTGQVKYSGGGASGLKVKVLKYMSGGVMPAVDSTYTDGSGNYSFPNLPAGTYILHARTDTILYPRTMNTFHDSTFQWNTATQFTLSCDDSTSKDITLVEVPLQNGQGRLAGTIVKGGTNKAGVFDVITGDPIPDVDITLRSKPAGMVKGNTKTDGSGRYEFFNIEPGDYDLWVDIPGLPMDSTYEVNVSANDSDFTELDFMVDSNSIYIPDDITTGRPTIPNVVTDLKAWPNPFRSNAMLIYGLKEDARVRLELVDLVGKTVSVVEDGFRKKGEHRQVITPDEHGLIPGVYLARLTVNGNVSTIRLVLME